MSNMGLSIHHSHFTRKPSSTSPSPTHSDSSDSPSPTHDATIPQQQPQPPTPTPTPQAVNQPTYRLIPPGKNHYMTLNIPITATPPEIRQAYHAALAVVPNNTSNADSESLHLQNVLDEALHILTHPYKKTVFDRAYTDELLEYHDRSTANGANGADGRNIEASNPQSNDSCGSLTSAEKPVTLDQWKASLMQGLRGEGEEEVFGRVSWSKVKGRKGHFKLDETFGATIEETILWAPNLFFGEVGGFDGWIG